MNPLPGSPIFAPVHSTNHGKLKQTPVDLRAPVQPLASISSPTASKAVSAPGAAQRELEAFRKRHGIPDALDTLSSKPLAQQVEMLTLLLQGLEQQGERKKLALIEACKTVLRTLADTQENIPQSQYDNFVSRLPSELKIDIQDIDQLGDEISRRMVPTLEMLMVPYEEGSKSDQAVLTKAHRFMAAMFESLRKGSHAIGKTIDFRNANIDEILLKALALAKEACRTAREDNPESAPTAAKYGFDRLKIDFLPKVHDAFRLIGNAIANLHDQKIAAHNVWRLCIDPSKLEMLCKLGITQESWTMGLLFDNYRSYLYKMGIGWEAAMQNLGEPISPEFIIELHRATAAGIPHPQASIHDEDNSPDDYLASGFSEKTHGYSIIKSVALSSQGKIELLEFVEKNKEYVRLENDERTSRIFGTEAFNLIQLGTPKEKLTALTQTWIDDYYKELAAATTSDEKVLAAIKLCQNLERLHPFEDGNYRVFGILLLNRLLAEQGESLTVIDEPSKLDGYSRAELLQEVREGQRRVASWE